MSKNKKTQYRNKHGVTPNMAVTKPQNRYLNGVMSVFEAVPPIENPLERRLWVGLSDDLRYTIAQHYFFGGVAIAQHYQDYNNRIASDLSEVIFALRSKFLMIQGLLMGDPSIKQLQNALTNATAGITASYGAIIDYWENVARYDSGVDLGDFKTNRPDIHGSVVEHLNALKALYEGNDKPIRTVKPLDPSGVALISAINRSNNASAGLQWLGEQANALHSGLSYVEAFNRIHYGLKAKTVKTALENEALAIMNRVIESAESRGADEDDAKKTNIRNWINRLHSKIG